MIIDNGEDIINIPVSEIQGEKAMSDGSTRFKFIGGPFHGMVFRVYAPFDTVRWPNGVTYDIMPPLNLAKSKKWTYVFNPEESRKEGWNG